MPHVATAPRRFARTRIPGRGMSASKGGALVGIRFALLAGVIFAVQDASSRHLAESYPVPFFTMVRYWFFMVFVLALAARRPGGLRAAARTRMPLLQILRGVLLATQIIVLVSSFDMIGLGTTHAIFSLHPLLATLLAVPLLGETVGWRRFLAVGAGFLGVLLILRPETGGAGSGFMPATGTLLALLAAVMISFYTVLTRLASRADGSAGPAFFYTGVAGAITLTLIGPWFWVEIAGVDLVWLLVLCIAGMSGHYCLIRALDATEAVRVQPFIYLQMVFGVIVGHLVFGEAIDGLAILGMAIIIGAGLYAIRREYLAGRSSG